MEALGIACGARLKGTTWCFFRNRLLQIFSSNFMGKNDFHLYFYQKQQASTRTLLFPRCMSQLDRRPLAVSSPAP